jgi:hypothetical protein
MFGLPVALPPNGRYPVGVSASDRRPTRATAELSSSELTLDAPVDGRVRITFR